MIEYLKQIILDMFNGMELIDIMAFIYIFRNMLSFFLWCIKQFKKSVGI